MGLPQIEAGLTYLSEGKISNTEYDTTTRQACFLFIPAWSFNETLSAGGNRACWWL